MADDLGRAFNWGCGVTLGVLFVLIGIPLAVGFVCCGGFAGFSGAGRDRREAESTSTSPAAKELPGDATPPGITWDDYLKRKPDGAAKPATADTFLGRNLNRDESVAFLDVSDSSRSYVWKTHKGKTVGITGTVHTAQWHTDRSEGLFAVITVRKAAPGRKELIGVANFSASRKDAVLALRKGDTVAIRGVIMHVVTMKDAVTVELDESSVVSHENNPERLAAEKADAAKVERERVGKEVRWAGLQAYYAAAASAETAAALSRIAAEKVARDDKDAATLLDLAKRQPAGDRRDKALRDLIKQYPKTKAAEQARELLK